jgi:EH domain-containing protein 1
MAEANRQEVLAPGTTTVSAEERNARMIEHRARVVAEAREIIVTTLDPIAKRYGYRNESLYEDIQGQPLVLLIGNYSSGKSTFINEFLGVRLQKVGQAPVDDSFTVILYDPETEGGLEEKAGLAVIEDPTLPFGSLRKFGQNFMSHLRLKRVNNPRLQSFGLIDSPGMLDSTTASAGRNYNYAEVVGELARYADLVLVLFDCHRPGTVAETHEVLQNHVIPAVGESKIVYIFNRIDEVENVEDLARAYGVLCWNLSQITQRKDVPTVYFTYSRSEAEARGNTKKDFDLKAFSDERELLMRLVETAPKRRADNIVNFLQEQTDRMHLYVQTLYNARVIYRQRRNRLRASMGAILVSGLLVAGLLLETQYPGLFAAGMQADLSEVRIAPLALVGLGTIAGLLLLLRLVTVVYRHMLRSAAEQILESPDKLVQLRTDAERQRWDFIRARAVDALQHHGLDHRLRAVARDLRALEKVRERYAEMRKIPSHKA